MVRVSTSKSAAEGPGRSIATHVPQAEAELSNLGAICSVCTESSMAGARALPAAAAASSVGAEAEIASSPTGRPDAPSSVTGSAGGLRTPSDAACSSGVRGVTA